MKESSICAHVQDYPFTPRLGFRGKQHKLDLVSSGKVKKLYTKLKKYNKINNPK